MRSISVITLILCNLIIFTTYTESATQLKNVTVSKCCLLDEYLVKDASGVRCVPGNQEYWTPRIYSARKKKLLTQGMIPSNWHVKEAQRPECNATYFPLNHQRTTGIVFENGSMWLLEYSKFVRPSKFCIDLNAALVCLDEVLISNQVHVKKCCGNGAVYKDTKKSCVTIKGSDYKIDLDEDKTLIEGFPPCDDDHMVIAGKLHEADLQENGSLLLDEANVLLPAGDFCLEHVLENAGNC